MFHTTITLPVLYQDEESSSQYQRKMKLRYREPYLNIPSVVGEFSLYAQVCAGEEFNISNRSPEHLLTLKGKIDLIENRIHIFQYRFAILGTSHFVEKWDGDRAFAFLRDGKLRSHPPFNEIYRYFK